MAGFLVSRLLQAFVVFVLSSIILFFVLHVLPGDPAASIAGQYATPAQVQQIREQLGLSGSLPHQYIHWVNGMAHGDFGASVLGHYPVSDRLKRAFPPTAELTVAAMIIALLIGVPYGAIAGARPRSGWDYSLAAFTGLSLGMPGFFLGILAVLVFAIELKWLPASGYVSLATNPADAIKQLILPAVTLGLASAGVFARFVRSAVQQSLRDDYVRTARAKGLAEQRVILGHVLPNSFIPLITIVALQTGRLLGGAVIIEQVFAWPGLGTLVINGVVQRDYLVVQGCLVIFVCAFIGANLVADIMYGVVDPRVRSR